MSSGFDFMMTTFMVLAGVVAFVLLIIYVMVPLFQGIGSAITNCFRAIAWFFAHIFEFIGGTIGDVIRCVGAIFAMLVLAPLSLLNVMIGRWSAAAHFADSVKREFFVTGACLYRVLLRRPLKLFWLHGLLEGLEERVPEAVYASPGTDKPRHPVNQFDGYTIVGSLAGGGSGGKLYIARPDEDKRRKLVGQPEHVVIKAFALTEGSSLPQIVRESRALECAKQLGHVLDHGMDEHRFHYVMPYHPGDHLGIITRQLHGQADNALGKDQLAQVMSYIKDLLATLSLYHEGGLWHKDVKPENIIVHDGRAHLVDLGLVTPLKSAMTLTTHGTEYFRDPEMVRQALRGVKVHQVDGAKFDIYAVGAVLYFMIENTFPAHGGLSRFSKKSPEALRWIIRRAMAEYHQRYTSAAMVLADIEAVAGSGDPFTFKPAELPSMRGANTADIDAAIHTESPQAAQVSAAGSSPPSREQVWGFGVGIGSGGPFVGTGPSGQNRSRSDRPSRRRPLLRITNWWTGAYVVDDDTVSQKERGASPAPTPTPTQGRLSAREQIKRARARAYSRRSRAEARRHKVGLERQPSAMLGFLVVVFLVILAMVIIPVVRQNMTPQAVVTASTASEQSGEPEVHPGRPVLALLEGGPVTGAAQGQVHAAIERYRHQGFNVVHSVGVPHDEVLDLYSTWQDDALPEAVNQFEDFLAEHDLYGFLHIKVVTSEDGLPSVRETLIRSAHENALLRRRAVTDTPATLPPSRPYLLINDHPAKSDPRVQQRVTNIIDGFMRRGWKVVVSDDDEVAARKVMPSIVHDSMEMPQRLSQILHQRSFDGVLYIDAAPGEAEPHDRVRVQTLPRGIVENEDVD